MTKIVIGNQKTLLMFKNLKKSLMMLIAVTQLFVQVVYIFLNIKIIVPF